MYTYIYIHVNLLYVLVYHIELHIICIARIFPTRAARNELVSHPSGLQGLRAGMYLCQMTVPARPNPRIRGPVAPRR